MTEQLEAVTACMRDEQQARVAALVEENRVLRSENEALRGVF